MDQRSLNRIRHEIVRIRAREMIGGEERRRRKESLRRSRRINQVRKDVEQSENIMMNFENPTNFNRGNLVIMLKTKPILSIVLCLCINLNLMKKINCIGSQINLGFSKHNFNFFNFVNMAKSLRSLNLQGTCFFFKNYIK